MTWFQGKDPIPGDARSCDAIEQVIVPRSRDIGDFEVNRVLPSAKRRMVGPFIFFDQFGPALMRIGQGMNVRPHPHIGLATVTWLFAGKIFHRDSLGSAQPIAPGELNWMSAGRGIVHSERTTAQELAHERQVFGIQSWVALPAAMEESAPAFDHYGAADLPVIEDGGIMVRLIAGEMYGAKAPVKTLSDLFYAEALLAPGARLPLPATYDERAAYVCEGAVVIAGERFEAGRLLVFKPGEEITIEAPEGARVQLLGGEPMDGPRHIWWNFVSSSKERIEQAKAEWRAGRFDIVPGDEEEFIPLPE